MDAIRFIGPRKRATGAPNVSHDIIEEHCKPTRAFPKGGRTCSESGYNGDADRVTLARCSSCPSRDALRARLNCGGSPLVDVVFVVVDSGAVLGEVDVFHVPVAGLLRDDVERAPPERHGGD